MDNSERSNDDPVKWATGFLECVDKFGILNEGMAIAWFDNAMEHAKPAKLTKEESLHIAARIWCRPETANIPMDTTLAEAFADVLRNGEPE